MERRLRLSVVVPARNEADTIAACLGALTAQTPPPHEVLVVDNASTDDTAKHARAASTPRCPVRVLSQTATTGLIATRNAGFDAATGDIIARIDADTLVGRGWTAHLASAFAATDLAATSGPVGYYDLPYPALNRHLDNLARRALVVLSGRNRFLFGSNMALRGSAWRAIKPTVCADTADRFHEDIDLAIHLSSAGLRISYLPRLRASVSARSTGRSLREFSDYARRFNRTLDAHRISRRPLRVAGALLRIAYPALHSAHRYKVRRTARANDRTRDVS